MDKIICIVTGADTNSLLLKRERYIEYMMSLFKIFSYSIPTYGVLSEYTNTKDSPPFSNFPFKIIKYINEGVLDNNSKSKKEYISIHTLIEDMRSLAIDDDTFVIKISGRYLLLDDSFINLVKDNISNPNVNSIVRLCERGTMQHTFLYALRYKYFKAFYEENPYSVPNGECIETRTLQYLKNNNLYETTLIVNSLGILTNINSEGDFKIY